MYIDNTICEPQNIPIPLKKSFLQLDAYYHKNDWFSFDNLFEVVEAEIKSYYLNGKITQDELNTLFRKYGIL
jgi:hypothetical protein